MSPVVADDYTIRLARRKRARRRKAAAAAASDDAELRTARRGLTGVIRQLPAFARMIAGLLTDRRVSRLDKALLGVVLAYIVLPFDLIPDAIPFLGQVDDVYLLMLALQRLVGGTNPRVLRQHWPGSPRELRALDIPAIAGAAALFLPRTIRRRLRGML